MDDRDCQLLGKASHAEAEAAGSIPLPSVGVGLCLQIPGSTGQLRSKQAKQLQVTCMHHTTRGERRARIVPPTNERLAEHSLAHRPTSLVAPAYAKGRCTKHVFSFSASPSRQVGQRSTACRVAATLMRSLAAVATRGRHGWCSGKLGESVGERYHQAQRDPLASRLCGSIILRTVQPAAVRGRQRARSSGGEAASILAPRRSRFGTSSGRRRCVSSVRERVHRFLASRRG